MTRTREEIEKIVTVTTLKFMDSNIIRLTVTIIEELMILKTLGVGII